MLIRTSLKYEYGSIQLEKLDTYKNVVNIDNVDYFLGYLNPDIKGNKGANSYVFTLTASQDDSEYNSDRPQKVIKISRRSDNYNGQKISRHQKNERFYREMFALLLCKKHKMNNIVKIETRGHIVCKNNYFPFYIMDYASNDLKNFLENNDIDNNERINLCLQVAQGIKELREIGFYHRDIKPDNILIFENKWKIGDLGLVTFRDKDYDDKNEFIGPRGWISPEAMNKYLCNDKNIDNFDCKIDHQSDIFQLGKLFWYILQGNAPIGCVEKKDYYGPDIEEIFSLLKSMLSHSKELRPKLVDDVIEYLENIKNTYHII